MAHLPVARGFIDTLAARLHGLAKWSDRETRNARISELDGLASDLRKAGFITDEDFDHLHRIAVASANA